MIGNRLLFVLVGAVNGYGDVHAVNQALHRRFDDAVWWGVASVVFTCLLVREGRRIATRHADEERSGRRR
jgi:hypothetical protein